MRLFLSVVAIWLVGLCGCASPRCGPGLYHVEGECTAEPPDCDEACGAGQVCEVSPGPPACACAPGYAGNPCEWVGVIADELFEEDARHWERSKGATVLPSTSGPSGGGEGFLGPSVVCNAGTLSQTVVMPPYESGPLVAEVTYHLEEAERLAIGFNGAWTHLPATEETWPTERFCLGSAAYGELPGGSSVKIEFSASEKSTPCFAAPQRGTIKIDRFTIEPPLPGETCLAPNSVLNGEANVSEGGWRFDAGQLVDAGLAENAGSSGLGDAVRLHRPSISNELATATTEISVPKEGAQQALRFWWHGTAEHVFQVEIGTIDDSDQPWRAIDRLRANGGENTSIYCLPPWTYGSLLDLSFSLLDGPQGEATTLRVDDVELLIDPDCGVATDLLDPGFESAPNSWFGSYLFGPSTDTVRLNEDKDGSVKRARSGKGALELKYESDDADLRMETFIRVPESAEGQCSELLFYSDVPAAPEAAIEWVLGLADEGPRGALASGGGWKPNRVPLPPRWSGRWVRLQVRVGATEGSGISMAKQIFLDDFEIINPVPCPTMGP